VVNYLDTVKFTLTVTNNGPDAGVNVLVTDLLPAGLQFVSANASQGSYNETTGIWTIGELANGTVATLDIIAKAIASNINITNIANVSSDIYDPDMSNNRANATITVPAAADLAITKVANQTVVNYLDNVKFTLTVTNNGPDAATNVRVTDLLLLLPPSLQFVSANASQGSYNETTGIWTIGELANGAVATLDIIAKVVASNINITNIANVSSDIYDPDMSNNRANVTITVPPTGVSLGDLVSAANTVKAYYERYGRLPSQVVIAGQNYTMSQLLYLLTKATVNINVGNLSPIAPRAVGAPTSPSGSYRSGRLYKSAYVQVAANILSFIDLYGRAPNYAMTSLGRIPFARLVYMYSKIIAFYGTNNRLPNYVTI